MAAEPEAPGAGDPRVQLLTYDPNDPAGSIDRVAAALAASLPLEAVIALVARLLHRFPLGPPGAPEEADVHREFQLLGDFLIDTLPPPSAIMLISALLMALANQAGDPVAAAVALQAPMQALEEALRARGGPTLDWVHVASFCMHVVLMAVLKAIASGKIGVDGGPPVPGQKAPAVPAPAPTWSRDEFSAD